MLSTEIEKRLEESLVGKDTPTRVHDLVSLHNETLKEIVDNCQKIKPRLERDKSYINLIKKANYQWLYVEKILRKKYPNEDIPEDIFRQLTISLSVKEDSRLLKALDWFYIKKSDHLVFKTLREFVEMI